MSGISLKNFNLPWHQHDRYGITVYAKSGEFSVGTLELLQKAGLLRQPDGGLGMHVPRDWKPVWDMLHELLKQSGALTELTVAITADEETSAERKSPEAVHALAQSLWLGDALLENRVICYLQPVVSARDKIFGYESFARVKTVDGNVIAGDKIMAASKILGIEYAIDRHLHIQAIKTFVSSAFSGFLFVNFFPGFIHRPAVYLEGLSETAKSYGIISKHIVLDFTRSELPRDIAHLKSVCEYGRSRGYSVALDDIESLEGAKKLLPEIRPDFVKLDMRLVHHVADAATRETIHQIVELVHANGGTVIAEGVESDEMYQALRQLGVDLYQGYLFSPPMPVEIALQRGSGAA